MVGLQQVVEALICPRARSSVHPLAVQDPRAQAGVDGWPYITGQAEYMRDVGRGHPRESLGLLAQTRFLKV